MLAFRAANLAYLGDHGQASERLHQALESLKLQWCGPAPMQRKDFFDWFYDMNFFRRSEDREHIDAGFRKVELVGG